MTLLAALLFWAGGSISGTIVDQSGAVIAAAKVTAASEIGSPSRVSTGTDGRFVIHDLNPGKYSIEISMPGFSTKTIKAVDVQGNDETRLPPTELVIAVTGGCGPQFVPPVSLFAPIKSTTSELAGLIFAGIGARAIGAAITVYRPKSNRRVGSTRTNAEGEFTLTGLRPGIYQVQVSLRGHATLIVDGVEIRKAFRSEATTFGLTPCAHGETCPALKWISPPVTCL